jgi:hypothetical protein
LLLAAGALALVDDRHDEWLYMLGRAVGVYRRAAWAPWRAVNDYGIRIDYRTYDSPELGPHRRQHSGITAKRGLWEVHHDPYDLSRVFVRTPDGWVTAEWTHLPMVAAPFADFTWRHARRLAAQAGRDDTNETEVARVLDELLTRAQAGPAVTRPVPGWWHARRSPPPPTGHHLQRRPQRSLMEKGS